MEKIYQQIEVPINVMSNVFGSWDQNIKQIEQVLKVGITNRNGNINIEGARAKDALKTLEKLISLAQKGEDITEQNVNYIILSIDESYFDEIDKISEENIALTITGKPIRPKTIGQKRYINKIKENTVVFGVGPAGTGKTYLAMAMAITKFKLGGVNRIILTRPAIEAGESLGFLPGDLQQKIDPYLRPLYDALHEIMGSEAFYKNVEKGLIEVAPLAYMRGRTLNNAFIVLDEAQNTTKEQMKMFLTRIGFGSRVVITGDITQIDLPSGKKSGLVEAIKILDNINDIGIAYLSKEDVVRHPLVQKIIGAYELHEQKVKAVQSVKTAKEKVYKK